MKEMTIDSIRMSMMSHQRVVILKEKDAECYLPIWIGPAEAEAIALKLQNFTAPRPLTHDLLLSVIQAMGATVSFIIVSDLRNDTFYAKVILHCNGKRLEVDSRPSDAIALAVRAKAPIYAEESVMDKAGVVLDRETGKPMLQKPHISEGPASGQVDQEELRRMSAFHDFIKTLDLDDLGKAKS